MMMVNMERANMLDGQVRAQAAGVQAKNATLSQANVMLAKMRDLQGQAGPDGTSQMPQEVIDFCKANGITIPPPDQAKGALRPPATEAQLTQAKADLAAMKDAPETYSVKQNLKKAIQDLEANRAPGDLYKKATWDSAINHVKTFVDNLTSTSQLEMTQLQSVMNKFNQTTEGLSNWLSKDSQSKNTIVGNQR